MGLQSRGPFRQIVNMNTIRIWFLVFIVLCPSTWIVNAHRDSCNWSGSGLDNPDPSHMVRPLTLMCTKGHLKWSYPRGGLNVKFRLRTPTKAGSEFKVCVKVDPDFSGARIYLVGHRKLHLLHAGSGDSRPRELVRCFTSVKGGASIYVEAVLVEGAGHWRTDNTLKDFHSQLVKKVASFSYDLRPLSPGEYDDEFEECRPCTEKELLQFFCQSDFVIRGHMNSINHNEPMERSELGVKVTKVIRHNAPSNQNAASLTIGQTTTLHRPLKCGSKRGEGEFLFLGRHQLGDAIVTCAPRWQEWQRIRRKALLEDSHSCLLD